MSQLQSYLSSPKYGYDFVVATTQASINATMKEYLSDAGQPQVIMCYVMNAQGVATAIDYATLKANAKGSDPFAVPNNADVSTNQDIKNLSDAYFLYAFKASIGLPPGYAPAAIPDVVTLGGNTASVTYNMMCSTFEVTQAPYGPRGIVSWLNQSQPNGAAWLFTSQVDLRLGIADASAYSKLPAPVQAQIKNLGGNAFSVQQLLFDLDNAALETVPVITGVAPGSDLYGALQKMFLGAYFTALQKNGQPVLSYSITQSEVPPSTLTLTDLNMQVSPFVGDNGQPVPQPSNDQKNLATLSYLCAANGHQLPAASPFTWNWVDASQASLYHGVIAINRNTLAAYYASLLTPLVMKSCLKPSTTVTAHMMGSLDTTWNLVAYQTPTATYPTSGDTVLTLSYSGAADSHDKSGLTYGEFDLHTDYTCSVSFKGSTIVIVQHMVIWTKVVFDYSSADGNVVDKTITDTYTLSIDQNGHLQTVMTTATVDNSQNPDFGWFIKLISDFQDLINKIKDYATGVAATHLADIPAQDVRNFVFPGGRTFTYKDVSFSGNQDLVSHITYVQPSSLQYMA